MRSRVGLVLLLLVVVLVAGAAAPSASADPSPTDIPLPSSCAGEDPLTCLDGAGGSDGYTAAQDQEILTRIAGMGANSAGDGGTVATFFGSNDAVTQAAAEARALGGAADAGLVPDVATEAAVSGEAGGILAALPFEVTAAGLVAGTGGLAAGVLVCVAVCPVVYHVIENWLDGNSHANYVSYNWQQIGGQSIAVPSGNWTYGRDYEFPPYYNYGRNWYPFGWTEVKAYDNSKWWVFNYQLDLAHGSMSSGCSINCYPNLGQFGDEYPWNNGSLGGVPIWNGDVMNGNDPDSCENQGQNCVSYPDGLGGSTGVPVGLHLSTAEAAQATEEGLPTRLTWAVPTLDPNVWACGHIFNESCNTSGSCSNAGTIHCEFAFLTPQQMNDTIPRTETAAAPATPATSTVTYTPTGGDNQATRDKLKAAFGDACGNAIFDHLVMPAAYPFNGCSNYQPSGGGTVTSPPPTTGPSFAPFYLPVPLPGETVSDYALRLQAKQWTGAISSADDPMSYPTGSAASLLQPGAITAVTVGTGGALVTVPLYNPDGTPRPWPSSPPQVTTPNEPVVVQTVPETYVPPVAPGTCTSCAIDWTPIESLNLGTKFPFGAPAWVQNGLTAAQPGGGCPTLSIPYPTGLNSSGSLDMVWCSTAWETDYRPWVFPVIEALITIMAIWFVASRVLGLGDG